MNGYLSFTTYGVLFLCLFGLIHKSRYDFYLVIILMGLHMHIKDQPVRLSYIVSDVQTQSHRLILYHGLSTAIKAHFLL